MEARALLSHVWLTEHQEQPPLGAAEKFRIAGPAPDLLSQSLHFTKTPSCCHAQQSWRHSERESSPSDLQSGKKESLALYAQPTPYFSPTQERAWKFMAIKTKITVLPFLVSGCFSPHPWGASARQLNLSVKQTARLTTHVRTGGRSPARALTSHRRAGSLNTAGGQMWQPAPMQRGENRAPPPPH